MSLSPTSRAAEASALLPHATSPPRKLGTGAGVVEGTSAFPARKGGADESGTAVVSSVSSPTAANRDALFYFISSESGGGPTSSSRGPDSARGSRPTAPSPYNESQAAGFGGMSLESTARTTYNDGGLEENATSHQNSGGIFAAASSSEPTVRNDISSPGSPSAAPQQSSYRRITSRRLDHGNADTTSAMYQRANMASTAEMLATQYCAMSPAMAEDIQSAPHTSASAKFEQPPRGASQRPADGRECGGSGVLASPTRGGGGGNGVLSPVDPYSPSNVCPTGPLNAFIDNVVRLRESLVTKGGISYELTHRSRIDRTQFVPNDVTPASLGSVSLPTPQSMSQNMFSPGRVLRGSGSSVTSRSSNSPLRSAPLAPSRELPTTPPHRGSSTARTSSDGYMLVTAVSSPRGGSSGIVRGSSAVRGGDHSGAAYRFPTSRPTTPVREGSAVVCPSLGSAVAGYDYASRMQLVSPRRAVPSLAEASPGGSAFFYSKLEDRSSPGRRSMSPMDRYRPKASYC